MVTPALSEPQPRRRRGMRHPLLSAASPRSRWADAAETAVLYRVLRMGIRNRRDCAGAAMRSAALL